MRLGILRDVLDAALGCHDEALEEGDGEAPEADRGLVQDPLPAGQGFVTWFCERSDWSNYYRYYGVSDPSLVNTLQSGQFTPWNAATADSRDLHNTFKVPEYIMFTEKCLDPLLLVMYLYQLQFSSVSHLSN